jgi:hypothetical protein
MTKARTTIAARIVIMKAEKILWNKLNFNLFPSWIHLEVDRKNARVIEALLKFMKNPLSTSCATSICYKTSYLTFRTGLPIFSVFFHSRCCGSVTQT